MELEMKLEMKQNLAVGIFWFESSIEERV